MKIDLFAGFKGFYTVDGFTGPSPTITMKKGEKYIFDQTDNTNWMHPIGFAYYPDGAHEDKDEVEDASLVYKINNV